MEERIRELENKVKFLEDIVEKYETSFKLDADYIRQQSGIITEQGKVIRYFKNLVKGKKK